jgi:hypothetical protein
MSEQHRLHVFWLQRLSKQRIIAEIELSDRQIVGGTPIGVYLLQKF